MIMNIYVYYCINFSTTIIAKLWEDGKLDLDAPISKYIKDFPQKTFNDQPVEITTRMLLSHLGGIRAYEDVIINGKMILILYTINTLTNTC